MTLLFAATYPERTAAVILYGCRVSYVRTEDYPWASSREEWVELSGRCLRGERPRSGCKRGWRTKRRVSLATMR